jgi:hypothetical protein
MKLELTKEQIELIVSSLEMYDDDYKDEPEYPLVMETLLYLHQLKDQTK